MSEGGRGCGKVREGTGQQALPGLGSSSQRDREHWRVELRSEMN